VAAAKAFAKLASLTTAVTYRMVIDTAYDSETGDDFATIKNLAVPAFLVAYRARQIDGVAIRPGDQRAIMLRANLEAQATEQSATFAPSPEDSLTIAGKRWEVVSMSPDPVGAIHDCQIRAGTG